MNRKLNYSFILFIALTLLPLLGLFFLAVFSYFGENSTLIAFISFTFSLPLAYYHYKGRQSLIHNGSFALLMRIAFYVNFIIYMIAILAAFNLMIIGSFLFTGQSPIGMDLQENQAPLLIAIGLYLILISTIGIYFLTTIKKLLLSKPSSSIT